MSTIEVSASGGSALDNTKTVSVGVSLSGGGSVISTGVVADLYIPYNCTINSVTMLADQTGSIVVDIWKLSYGSYPAVNANSITALAPPTITAGIKSQDTTLTGWTKTLAAGDTLRFNVDSCSDTTRCTLVLSVTKT
jgi:hypothetical protein